MGRPLSIDTVTIADLREQFDLAAKVRDKVTEANEIVIVIRELKKQMEERLKNNQDGSLKTALDQFRDKLNRIEENVYQVRNRSGQDPLNFPIKLNNKMAALGGSIERGDGKPTAASYTVFKELSDQLAVEKTALDRALKAGLLEVNKLLTERNLKELVPTTTETRAAERSE